ncbi:MAG: hypothetical protein H9W82_16350 [Lactobacillus sp.]|nr:hypothetical protein [Lactobacillus sp.]
MVQIKQITSNFVTRRYARISQKPFSKSTFKSVIKGYLFLIGFMLVGQWAGNQNHIISREINYLLSIQIKISMGVIVLNFLGEMWFANLKLKKYTVLLAYFSAVAFPFFLLSLLACTTNNPVRNIIYGSLIIFLGWLIGMIVHILLVVISLKKESMEFRDKYGDYYTNISSVLGIISLGYGEIRDQELFLQVGFLLAMMALLIPGTFNFPRILPYWRKEEAKSDISVYGNATKLMKKGKSK